jgi:hypothetical protein
MDARKSRKLVKEVGTVVGKRTNKKASKLIDLVNRLHLENDVLRHENSNLKDTLHLEKRRRRKGKGLKQVCFDIKGNEAVVFSPAKIVEGRAKIKEAEEKERQEEEQKAQRKVRRALKKVQKEKEKEEKAIVQRIAKLEKQLRQEEERQ